MEKLLTEVSASSISSKVNAIPEVLSAKETEKCWRVWKNEFLSISNSNVPIKERCNPWINTEITKLSINGTILYGI